MEDKQEEPKPVFNMQPVESSNISERGYCKKTGTLCITFKSGGTFHFPGMSQENADAFFAAKSVGKAFHSMVRGKYESKKV